MNAIVLREHGGIEALRYEERVPEPEPRPGDALVRVRSTTVNRIDSFVREGYPGIDIPFPHIPGADIAGIVEHIGPEVDTVRPGDRVLAWPLIACGRCTLCRKQKAALCTNWKYFGLHVDGAYAQYVRVPEESLIPLPGSVSFEVASTLPVAGLTAYHALYTVGALQEGETVLIWGGSGGLGTFAVQLARQRGARVIATAGGKEKCTQVEALGADLVLDHHADDVAAAVRDFASGEGLEVVLDSVGADTFPRSFELLQKGGRLLLCGKLTGRDVPLSLHLTYLRHIAIRGLYLGEKAELEALLDEVTGGRITPVIDRTLALRQAGEAHRAMARGERVGKLVLTP